jgi:aspartokinase
MEEFRVVGVTADDGKALVTAELARASVMGALWDRAAAAHLTVLAPLFSEGKVYFYADRDAEGEWKKILTDLAVDGFLRAYDFDVSIVPVSVVGDRFTQDGLALSRLIDALAKAGVTATLGSASSLAFTVAVKATHADDAVRSLHHQFLGGESK